MHVIWGFARFSCCFGHVALGLVGRQFGFAGDFPVEKIGRVVAFLGLIAEMRNKWLVWSLYRLNESRAVFRA